MTPNLAPPLQTSAPHVCYIAVSRRRTFDLLTYDSTCNRPKTRRVFSGIGFRTWNPPAPLLKPTPFHWATAAFTASWYNICRSAVTNSLVNKNYLTCMLQECSKTRMSQHGGASAKSKNISYPSVWVLKAEIKKMRPTVRVKRTE
ncbi:hypothetical protein AVEN_105993-1 [Araneus ventricosus]|uniref:Uncharacterized protein n=1 Tax=Araneus ventricosus TaxID=182803 RepID=A0A4Y2P5K8_ARAVE|nr:hypothetical protein AVEN_105993-1 [Araneus ventricosus]